MKKCYNKSIGNKYCLYFILDENSLKVDIWITREQTSFSNINGEKLWKIKVNSKEKLEIKK